MDSGERVSRRELIIARGSGWSTDGRGRGRRRPAAELIVAASACDAAFPHSANLPARSIRPEATNAKEIHVRIVLVQESARALFCPYSL
uniref:Uncharacterized protein n=1 Tax=Angiostrongylus cantonensis TaxID=6313 RepID=A0A0K0DE80_ANGCA